MPRRYGYRPESWDEQFVPPEFDEAVYDDLLLRIRERGALDLLCGPPDLGAEGYASDRIRWPYAIARAAWERRRDEAIEAARRQAREAYRLRQQRAFLREREEAWGQAQVRRYVISSGSVFTCGCGHPPVAVLLPPPGWGGGGSMMCGGRFMYQCLCGKETGMESKRLAGECLALRELVTRYGWHEASTPLQSLPARTLPLNDVWVNPAPVPEVPGAV